MIIIAAGFLKDAIWIFICLFIYKHQSVVDELRPLPEPEIRCPPHPDIVEKYNTENDD